MTIIPNRPPTITEAYPPLPLAELLSEISRYENGDIDEKKDVIDRLVSHHVLLNFAWGKDWRYKRVRKLNEDETVLSVDDVIWQKGVPAAAGRANPADFGVLYLADRLDTALREARVQNNHVVAAEFQILPGETVRLYPIGELSQIVRSGFGFLAGTASSQISDLINACHPWDVARAMLITDAFLFRCVTAQDDYEISSQVVMSIFNKLPSLTVVGYASRQQPGSIAFATRIENFWDKWGIASVRTGRARHLAMGYFGLDEVRRVESIDKEGRFSWSAKTYHEREQLIFRPPWVPGAGRGIL